MKFKNIIFDLDGTLVDSSIDIIESLNKSYELEGYFNVEINSYHIGPKLNDLINSLTPNIDLTTTNKIINNYRAIYDNLIIKKSLLYSEVENILNNLYDNKYTLFIATNKPSKATNSLLNHFSIYKLFTDIYTPDYFGEDQNINKQTMISSILEKYKLHDQDTIMIGDHHNDIIAAKNNNISSIGVLYGYSKHEDIYQSEPQFVISNFSDLNSIIK